MREHTSRLIEQRILRWAADFDFIGKNGGRLPLFLANPSCGLITMIQLQDYFRSRVSQAAYDLFAVFSRFEYAMKKVGFRRCESADAAWTKFANHLPADIFSRLRATSDVEIYFDAPPDRLVADTGKGVRWSGKPTTPTTMSELLDCIKIARNNLFHGDKRHDNRRDTELMVAALFVLNHIYESIEHDPKFEDFISEMEYGL